MDSHGVQLPSNGRQHTRTKNDDRSTSDIHSVGFASRFVAERLKDHFRLIAGLPAADIDNKND